MRNRAANTYARRAPGANSMFHWLQRFFDRGSAGKSGDRGEALAAAWLVRARGFAIVARNWRSPRDRRDEIDLVCRDEDALVFVEVKQRAAGALVPGYFAVDERKKSVLRRAAGAYLAGLREKPRTIRFDVVEVETPVVAAPGDETPVATPPPAPVIRHFENIPLFPKNFRA